MLLASTTVTMLIKKCNAMRYSIKIVVVHIEKRSKKKNTITRRRRRISASNECVYMWDSSSIETWQHNNAERTDIMMRMMMKRKCYNTNSMCEINNIPVHASDRLYNKTYCCNWQLYVWCGKKERKKKWSLDPITHIELSERHVFAFRFNK